MKKILPLTYPPKIEPVRTYKCRQTIRMQKKIKWKEGDEIAFHDWLDVPYRSKWGWRTPYMRVNTVLPLHVKISGFELLEEDEIWEVDYYEWHTKYADHLSLLDGIVPESGLDFGKELGRLLITMHNLFKEREPPSFYRFQVIRWDKPESLEKVMVGYSQDADMNRY